MSGYRPEFFSPFVQPEQVGFNGQYDFFSAARKPLEWCETKDGQRFQYLDDYGFIPTPEGARRSLRVRIIEENDSSKVLNIHAHPADPQTHVSLLEIKEPKSTAA